MRIAYLDTIAGISGDMTLAAFVSAGVSLDSLERELGKLKLEGYKLRVKEIVRSGISAVKLDVVIINQPKYHRHLKDIHQIIDSSELSEKIKDNAKNIFKELAIGEATVHKTSIEKIHFHEVGALDAIIDIVGTAICLELLQIEKVYSSPVKLGSGGFVNTEHGTMPIPTPATIEILKNYPTVLTNIPFELTTPTGAAIVKALSSGVISVESFEMKNIGYGSGSKDLEIPNLLRLIVAELEILKTDESLVVMETNIDDMNPEIYPYVIQKLFSAGAHDAYLSPIIMKKGRPGILLSVLVEKTKLEKISPIIFSQTSTLGIRIHHIERQKVERKSIKVATTFGDVQAKLIAYETFQRITPEFEECKRIAEEKGIPLIEVYKTLEKEFTDRNITS